MVVGKFKRVHLVGIVLVSWSRILSQDFGQCFLFVLCYFFKFSIRIDNFIDAVWLAEYSAGGFWLAVGVGYVGFDVVYGGSIHQVGARQMQNGAEFGVNGNALQPDG